MTAHLTDVTLEKKEKARGAAVKKGKATRK